MPRYREVDICVECGVEFVTVNKKISSFEIEGAVDRGLKKPISSKCRDCGNRISSRNIFVDDVIQGTITC